MFPGDMLFQDIKSGSTYSLFRELKGPQHKSSSVDRLLSIQQKYTLLFAREVSLKGRIYLLADFINKYFMDQTVKESTQDPDFTGPWIRKEETDFL
ncbi:hypothetical protein RCL_jg16007.t1 [Rhizophagus clarus]|uniref:Uncharacterized protein n=1 Tax=Rhizophagus clarus TaxID=94130 RepID=A0A8H3QNN5_9GLOM|nr:hypothetical protein RCL_jg16007.t1 [Rhizophagus clarus]